MGILNFFVVLNYFSILICLSSLNVKAKAYNPFHHAPTPKLGNERKPKLILIAGSPGTGKSTFGMSVALDQGVLKCISTDTIRAVMRSFVPKEVSPALHRSSYCEAFEGDDPIRSWKETCNVLHGSIESLVDDAIARRVSLVIEGVHLIPSKKLLKKWENNGGIAIGVLLQIQDASSHINLLKKRGLETGNISEEEKKIHYYDRIRLIQDELVRCAKDSGWLQIEQKTERNPLEIVSTLLADGNENFDAVHETVIFRGLSSEMPESAR